MIPPMPDPMDTRASPETETAPNGAVQLAVAAGRFGEATFRAPSKASAVGPRPGGRSVGTALTMINYTDRVTVLMQDIVSRVPDLSFIDTADVVVFARCGRSDAEGAFATCHCLSLPPSEPGYYFWRDRGTGRSHADQNGSSRSRPCDDGRALDPGPHVAGAAPFLRSDAQPIAQGASLPGDDHAWIAKLDTVVHELFHIDPETGSVGWTTPMVGTRGAVTARISSASGATWLRIPQEAPGSDVRLPAGRLRHARARPSGVVGKTFRRSRRIRGGSSSGCLPQPRCEGELPGVDVEPLRTGQQTPLYRRGSAHPAVPERDLPPSVRKGQFRAASPSPGPR